MDKVRAKAVTILHDIDTEKAYMNLALAASSRDNALDTRDAAFLNELVRGVLRNRERLDYTMAAYSSLRLKKLSPWIVNILRMGIYQLCFMDKVPSSAAVNESVKLARRFGHAASAGFVNALLRTVSAKGEAPLPKEGAEALSVRYSYPLWMAQRLIEDFGWDRAESLMRAGNDEAPLVIRANTLKISPEQLEEKLGDAVASRHGVMLVIKKGHAVQHLSGFSEGLFTVQAEPFHRAAELLLPEAGMRVADACAAPGGKTTYVAELMKDSGEIYAFDIYEHKLKLIEDTSNRLGIHIIKTALHDATLPLSEEAGLFDRLLLDVPCSGLGIIRRRPDIKWHREPEDFAAKQYRILETMSASLKAGGILVYSTCTMDRRENEAVVQRFLATHDAFSLMPFDEGPAGYRTWYPDTDGTDGAFICRMIRE